MPDMLPNARPKVSVVVPVYNGARTLIPCLDSLMNLDVCNEQIEIIVVDNNSTDETKEVIRQYPVIYLFEKNRGRGWARNRGAMFSKGEFVAFTDADCIVEKEWIKQLLGGFEDDERAAVCGGKILAFRQKTLFEKYVETRGILDQQKGIEGKSPQDLPRVVTANAMFRKSVLEEAGYFDEDLLTSEDTELSWRISFLGHEIKYVPEAVVYHQHTKTFKTFLKHHFDFGRAAVVINQKYGKIYLGVGGPSSALGVFVFSLAAAGLFLIRLVKNIFYRRQREPVAFLFLDALVNLSYNLGALYTILETLIFRRGKISQCKIPLKNFIKTLSFCDNGGCWSLNHPATWFLNQGILRLVVFVKGVHVYTFNKTATRIWMSLSETKDFKKTVADLAQEYNIAVDRMRQDTEEFMGILKTDNLLTIAKN